MMHYFSFVASGIDARCANTRRKFGNHGGELYEFQGKAILDFKAKHEVIDSAVERAINLVKAEGGTVEQVWTQQI